MGMPIIDLDATGWNYSSDVYDALATPLESPAWHTRSIDAFLDTMVWHDINGVCPPYSVRARGLDKAQEDVRKEVQSLRDYLLEARLEQADATSTQHVCARHSALECISSTTQNRQMGLRSTLHTLARIRDMTALLPAEFKYFCIQFNQDVGLIHGTGEKIIAVALKALDRNQKIVHSGPWIQELTEKTTVMLGSGPIK